MQRHDIFTDVPHYIYCFHCHCARQFMNYIAGVKVVADVMLGRERFQECQVSLIPMILTQRLSEQSRPKRKKERKLRDRKIWDAMLALRRKEIFNTCI